MTEISLSGGDKLEAKLAEIAAKVARPFAVRVGFLEGKDYPDGTPVAMVAAINNFGAPAAGIPARPFFDSFIKNNSDGWGEDLAKGLKANDYDVPLCLNGLGLKMTLQLSQSIIEMDEPANSPVTNLLKQRFPMREGMTFGDVMDARRDVANGETAPAGKPLSWTGKMLSSISHEVSED